MGLFGPPNIEKMTTRRDINGLIKALNYKKDSFVRSAAARAMGKIGDNRAAEPLIIALKDSDQNVREAAACALAEIGIPAVEPLIATMKDSDQHMHAAVVGILVKIGTPAAEWLITTMKDKYEMREDVAVVLAEMGTPAIEPLIAAMKDSDQDVRGAAARALGRIGNPRAVESLITALMDGEQYVRYRAADALEKVGWRPGQNEAGAAYWVARREWVKCIAIGSQSVDPLIIALKSREQNLREAAVDALEKIGDTHAVVPLIAAMKDNDQEVRRAAARALGKIGDPRAVGSLITALEDKNQSVRKMAEGALVQIGMPAVDQLIAALRNSNQGVCKMAEGALVQIGMPAVDQLIAALRNSNQGVCKTAAGILGEIGDPRAVESLITALEDKNQSVREMAEGALVQIGMPAVDQLIAALRNSNQGVCETAARILGKIGWQPGQDETGAFYWMAQRKWEKCIEIGSPAVGTLLAVLKSSDHEVCKAAVYALGKIGDARAIEPLTVVLKYGDWSMKEAALAALKKIGWLPGQDEAGVAYWICKRKWKKCIEIGEPAVELLIAALKDSDSSMHATITETLVEIGDPRVIEPLFGSLWNPLLSERKIAAEALVKLYQSNRLPETDKIKILSKRDVISRSHTDTVNHYDESSSFVTYGDCSHTDSISHDDLGIGVPFLV